MKQLVLLLILFGASSSVLADAGKGKKLHDENCMKCHGNEVYTRKDRFISSRAALDKQVKRCQLNVGAQWFDEDANSVADYLDQSFYHFAK
jgi:mono/diheme cytochrome c family protein